MNQLISHEHLLLVPEGTLNFSVSFKLDITQKNYQLNDAKQSSRLYIVRHLVNFRGVLSLWKTQKRNSKKSLIKSPSRTHTWKSTR